MVRHVLNVGGDIDKRMRMASKRKTLRANSRTLCGAPVDADCTSKDAAEHTIREFSQLRPEWVAELCVSCLAALEVKS